MPVGPYNTKSSEKCKRDLIQISIHWSYVSSSLTHQIDVPYIPILELHREMKVVVCDHMMWIYCSHSYMANRTSVNALNMDHMSV